MTQPVKILAFAGSTRIASFNKKLVKIAAAGAKAAGAEVTYIDLLEYPMPLFNEDLEAQDGLPDTVIKFKTLLKSHQGFLIACPEYNGSITPLLKNAIDWASRSEPGEPPMALSCFQGKVAALLAASPGGLGGIRGLVHVRAILEGIGVTVIPQQKAISNAYQAFDDHGNLKEERQIQGVQAIAQKLAEVTAKLSQ
ncbi:NAD(P)H-dependent oxidoreductase [Nodularia harveyana UHCC-0300]|uniref:NAD(P)H-dependent oxidoreductase n=1 Tax=Nodularia harveyana UHCC-0300 TaxID=2974287 RepID=A0ABU5UHZ4_9CYAN|nr:NAD(P)H-dependent oxidoreductase [Nodularia harveyana]MEA5583130.1 NAD(P)H-dependent oxidoreductase [Nodularia harveyana UHCC-0300]